MYFALSPPESGVISINQPEGSPVDVCSIIATLDLDDPSKVRRAEQFDRELSDYGPFQTAGTNLISFLQ